MNTDSWFQCKLNKEDVHLFKDPRLLECGTSACYDCIKRKLFGNAYLTCESTNCNESHLINDVESLKPNEALNSIIQEECENIVEILISNAEMRLIQLKNEFHEKRAHVSQYFDIMRENIFIRVDSIKADLDILTEELLKEVSVAEENIICEYENIIKQEHENYRNFLETVGADLNRVDVSKETILKNLHVCQSYLTGLNNIDKLLYKKLADNEFKYSEWKPKESIIGRFSPTVSNFDVWRLRNLEPVTAMFENWVDHTDSICNLNDSQLLVSDSTINRIVVCDRLLNPIKYYGMIGEVIFDAPLGICSDNRHYIFICDTKNNRLLASNFQLTVIEYVIQAQIGSQNLKENFIDACVSDNELYVLDNANKQISIFALNGCLKSSMPLVRGSTDSSLLNNPVRISVCNSVLAVLDNFEHIYLYKRTSEFIQALTNYQSKTRNVLIDSNRVYSIDETGLLKCFKKSNKINYEYNLEFERYFANLKSKTTFMTKFNDKLVLSSGLEPKIMVI